MRLAETERPDLILMDIQVAGMTRAGLRPQPASSRPRRRRIKADRRRANFQKWKERGMV